MILTDVGSTGGISFQKSNYYMWYQSTLYNIHYFLSHIENRLEIEHP